MKHIFAVGTISIAQREAKNHPVNGSVVQETLGNKSDLANFQCKPFRLMNESKNNNGENQSDKELLELVRDPEKRNYGFNLLVKKYQKKIYWVARRMVIDHDDADDVVQNVFINVWKGLDRFRSDSNLYTWMYRIAVNESVSFLRKKRMKFFVPWEKVEYHISETLQDDNYFKGDEVQLKLQKAILTLPEKQRIVFNMRYYDEMPYQEMSEVLTTSEGALKASFHHAVKKVEEYLRNNE